MSKVNLTKINISSSFLFRACCKKCGSKPTYYWHSMAQRSWKNPRDKINDMAWYRGQIKRIGSSWFFIYNQPRYVNKAQDFNFILDKGFSVNLHNSKAPVLESDYVISYLSCECSETSWKFNNKSLEYRPEVFNRKSKNFLKLKSH